MTVRRYAQDTTVDVFQSRAEIERTLTRYGAEDFASGMSAGNAVIGFRVKGRSVRFDLPLPKKDEFARTPEKNLVRSPEQQHREWERACRQAWRALALAIKAKLEVVECGITSFEDEFLSHIIVPGDGRTIGDWIRPQLEESYKSGKPIALLPMPGDPRS